MSKILPDSAQLWLLTTQPFYLIQIRHGLADKNVVHVGLHLGVQKAQELLFGQLQILVPGNIVQIYTLTPNDGNSSHIFLSPHGAHVETSYDEMALMY